jgi:hypothetical protein
MGECLTRDFALAALDLIRAPSLNLSPVRTRTGSHFAPTGPRAFSPYGKLGGRSHTVRRSLPHTFLHQIERPIALTVVVKSPGDDYL